MTNIHKKCLAKKCSLHPHVPKHILYFQKKVPGKKCHLLPQSTLTQALNIFSVVSSPVTFLHLWRKKCLGEKKCLGTRFPGSRILCRPDQYAEFLPKKGVNPYSVSAFNKNARRQRCASVFYLKRSIFKEIFEHQYSLKTMWQQWNSHPTPPPRSLYT